MSVCPLRFLRQAGPANRLAHCSHSCHTDRTVAGTSREGGFTLIRVQLNAEDVARTRFGHSAVWETTAAAYALTNASAYSFHNRALAKRLTPTARDALSALKPLLKISGWMPDALAAAPAGSPLDPASQFSLVLDTHRDVVANDQDVVRRFLPRSEWRAFSADQYVETLAVSLVTLWQELLCPVWERIDAVVNRDIHERYRSVAREGVGAALNQVHPDVRYESSTLSIRIGLHDCRAEGQGQGVWLVPSVFRWAKVGVSAEVPGPIVVSYPASGSGNIWESSPSPDQGVEALMGRTRARILHSVQSPATTTQLAADLDLAPATVSAHLSTLTSAGLVHRTRQGRLVLYARTLLGSRLLGHAQGNEASSTFVNEAAPYGSAEGDDIECG